MAHKEIQRQNTIEEIKGYARKQMETVGPSGLSMNAIARSMEISTPALYRYFGSRDDLIRTLIGDSIDNLTNALIKADNNQPPEEYARRFWSVTIEYREWALAHTSDFQLIFNNLRTNDQRSRAKVQQGIQHVFMAFAHILWNAYHEGRQLLIQKEPKSFDELEFGILQPEENKDNSIPAPVVYTSLMAWSRIHGLVMLELAAGLTSQEKPWSNIYRQEVAVIMKNMGLEPTQSPAGQNAQQTKPAIRRVKPHMADDLHVIFGSGPLGLAVMRELIVRGKQVRMVTRSEKSGIPENVEQLSGDAFQVEFTRSACQNAAVVYQCAQPAKGAWLDRFAALNAAIVDGAAAKGAKFIYGDNLLQYGVVEGSIHEGLANKSQTRKGQIRARVSEAVLTAHRSGRVRAAIGRASDFFGPLVTDGILGERSIVPLLQGKVVAVLGDPDIPHTFTYIEDFGRALVVLGEREEALGQIWHVPNPPTLTQSQFLELFCKEAGLPLKIHGTSRRMLALKSLFSPDAREKVEVLYQFEKPFIVDSSKYERTFHMIGTPLVEAVRRTVNWYREFLV